MKKKIAIIGGGPSGLIAAFYLSKKHDVAIFEKGKAVGRKFLVAGNGGFNLTNEVSGNELIQKFSPEKFLQKALTDFSPADTRAWLKELGIETFVGTSGRIFPDKEIKPAEVLKKIIEELEKNKVEFFFHHEFVGFDENNFPLIENEDETFAVNADAYIFNLGGASWSKTGSTGDWTNHFNKIKVTTLPFQSSNCGINIDWPDAVKNFHEGKPIKNIALKTGEDIVIRGEALITKYGLEGNAVYPIVPEIRSQLAKNETAEIRIDFKPDNNKKQLLAKLNLDDFSTKQYAKRLNLNSIQMALLKAFTKKDKFLDPYMFVGKIKNLNITTSSLRPIEEAISTIGGISSNELNPNFSLKKHPTIFTIGEMVDWDAPTGGFLLQACFSMGKLVAEEIGLT